MDNVKKFEDFLDRMQGLLDNAKKQGRIIVPVEDLENAFPELKESEDERMRNAAINACKYMVDNFENSTKQYEDAIAWLEKQGEQKAVISDDALREGIIHFGITQYQIDNWLKKYVHVEKQGEQKPTDKEMIEALRTEYEKGRADAIAEVQKSAWSEDDEKIFRSLLKALTRISSNTRTDSTSINYSFFTEIEWIKSLKDRVQPIVEWKHENTGDLTDFENAMMHIGESFFSKNAGLNPNDTNTIKEQANILAELVQSSKEWSEEDEKKITLLIDILKVNHPNGYFKVNPVNTLNMEAMPTEELVSWLESIKQKMKGA